MRSFSPNVSGTRPDARQLFIETFRDQIARLERGTARIRIPETRRLFERHPQMAYHFKPELFIQLRGETEFRFPDQSFVLQPGDLCVMPRGVPHAETALPGSDPFFQNVVVCYYNETVAIHVAAATADRRPVVDDIHFFTTTLYADLIEYLNRTGDLRLHDHAVCATATKGLLLAELALLLALVEEQDASRYSESERIFQCQWLIRNNIDDPELGVDSLAQELRCSAGHLSRQFQKASGERIPEYINRIRLNNAVVALRQTNLSVKEIATACGFNDPSYFTRVFRKAIGHSPVQFRSDQQHIASQLEREPKAVFFDREEHDFGLRPEVMANAKVTVAP